MAKHRSEIEIARRCFDFLIEKYGSVKNVIEKTPVSRSTLYMWRNSESSPSAYYLQFLLEIGADMSWLLLGRKVIANG